MSVDHNGGNIQNAVTLEEHQGNLNAKRVVVVDGSGGQITTFGSATVALYVNLSFYKQASLVSGYIYYGFTPAGGNPTTSSFKLQRETLSSGEVLFGGGLTTFVHTWSSASLASINYS